MSWTVERFANDWYRAEYCDSTARRDDIRRNLWMPPHVGAHCPVVPGQRVECIHLPDARRIVWPDPHNCDWKTVTHWRPLLRPGGY